MPSFEHSQLVKRVATIDHPPAETDQHDRWLGAHPHLQLLDENARADELIIHAIGKGTFIHTVVVRENELFPLDQKDLLEWNGNAFASRAGYSWKSGQSQVRVEHSGDEWHSETLKGAQRLVFGRVAEGFGDGEMYYEILQEYTHLSDIHWRPEYGSYCRINQVGDIDQAISFTQDAEGSAVSLVSFHRDLLDQYLALTDSVLVRLFDFTLLLDLKSFQGWPDSPEITIERSDTFFARQKVIPGYAAYTRGVQIIRSSRPKSRILKELMSTHADDRYIEFKALDFRHDRVADISTDPSATTNYFEAHENSLPFETSPAFFRSEVLVKYKNDREKYEVLEESRLITCRGGWSLRRYDINEVGQVHAYICYLRSLPYEEQVYWLSFNEQPKVGISKRALVHDFKGEWADFNTPLGDILSLLRKWNDLKVPWWVLGSETLLAAVNTPYTDSVEEWSRAFLDLAKLLVEGFQLDVLRADLKEHGIKFEKGEKTIALFEKKLVAVGSLPKGQRLSGLRELQSVRSLVASHAPGSEATDLKLNAQRQHGSYKGHFESACTTIAKELAMIEQAFGGELRQQAGKNL